MPLRCCGPFCPDVIRGRERARRGAHPRAVVRDEPVLEVPQASGCGQRLRTAAAASASVVTSARQTWWISLKVAPWAVLIRGSGNPAPGPKFDYKRRWFERLTTHTADLLASGAPVALCWPAT